jgi:uncharacterized protein YgbK (DUF1537 family)
MRWRSGWARVWRSSVPAFPANGRSIYQGYLFVGAVPLHESSMKDHPLTPMRDSSLMRLMGAQTAQASRRARLDYAAVLARVPGRCARRLLPPWRLIRACAMS